MNENPIYVFVCPACKGAGGRMVHGPHTTDGMVALLPEQCPHCQGTGELRLELKEIIEP